MPSQQVQRLENSMSRKLFQRVFTLVSIVSFFGSTAYGAIGTISSALKQPKNDATTTSRESKIQSQEKGYQLVLQREPENQVALEGLVTARLQMQDGRGAIAPLEKLVKLNPHRQEYKTALAQVKKQVSLSSEKK